MLKKIFFYIAAAGWVLSLVVHFLSIDKYDITDKIPYIWALHIFLIVVWLPAILYLVKDKEFKNMTPSAVFKSIYKKCPFWVITICLICFIYAGINFSIYLNSYIGSADIIDGQYVLQNKGALIKNISEEEYHEYNAAQTRAFSGHWLVFYGIAAVILFPSKKQVENDL
ncbi:MAG: hypothetical protein ACK5M3_02425 [Dysgonomonas sp.]